MTQKNKIFTKNFIRTCATSIICATFCNSAIAALTITQSNSQNCSDEKYRANHPTQCQFFVGVTPILGTVTVVGGAAFIINMAGGGFGGAGGGKASSDQQTIQPTMTTTTHDMIGADVDTTHLAAIQSTYKYRQNVNQYNDIRLAYSLARGYTGAGTTIAVLDSSSNYWHGGAVAKLASGQIAPNATVESYEVSTNNHDFLSYREIGDVIASASNANVYNSSWSVQMRATDIHSRAQAIALTDENFITQISNAATQRDAIFVWAAGNDYSNQSSALSALPRVMPELDGHFVNVVAYDSDTNSLAEYSNECGITKDYCITAPGSHIDTGDRIVNGTSFATPIVSAAIAVIREAYPYMNASEITDLLFTTARDLGTPGVDEVYGHGMLDLERATRPVGAPLVAINETVTQPLTTARVAAPIAHNIKSANVQFAFFDSFGRPFTTKMSDNIRSVNTSRAFEYLRGDETDTKMDFGPFELGFQNKEFLLGDGFMKLQKNATSNFVGIHGNTQLGSIRLFNTTRFAMTNARTMPESFVTDISPIYTTTVKFGAEYNDWTFAIAVPDMIVSGDMNLRTPVGRANNGQTIYADTRIDLASRPAVEYSAKYKMLTATFVDNPYGTDEFFVVARGKVNF